MLTLAICNAPAPRRGIEPLGVAAIPGARLPLARVSVARPYFDASAGDTRSQCLLRVEAFSCNYRDRAIAIFGNEQVTQGNGTVSFLGSEFSARVEAVGDDVCGIRVGDRVMPDATYPLRVSPAVQGGVVTNQASRGWLVLHPDQVIRVPEGMDPVVAAAFSLGAQTACSMVRRANVKAGGRALVLSGRSNTSLFVAQRLLHDGVAVTVASRGECTPEHRRLLPGATFLDVESVTWKELRGRFDAVFDPFFDLHVGQVLEALDYGGHYVTCGLQAQHDSFAQSPEPATVNQLLTTAIVRNLVLVGNCIGQRKDLEEAVALFACGGFRIPVDSVWGVADARTFIERSFANRGRLGKVVMAYGE